jgi:AcrR family transcriptional regulator
MPDRALREIAIDAACLLVQEGKAASLSMAEVARAIDVEERQLEAVFGTVEDLIVAIADRTYATFLTQVDAAVGEDESEGAYTRAYVRAQLGHIGRAEFSGERLPPGVFQPHPVVSHRGASSAETESRRGSTPHRSAA